MKVAIITYHFPLNCGAVLQCLALSKYVGKENEVEIINYQPKYHTNIYRTHRNPFLSAWYIAKYAKASFVKKIYLYIRNFISVCLHNIKGNNRRELNKKFSPFMVNLKTTELYTSRKSLMKNPPYADAYIVGSDQVWNSKVTSNYLDKSYFLDFAKDGKKIGYAISENLRADEIDSCLDLIKEFDAISFREEKSISKYEKYNIKSSHVLDPTLLLDSKDYKEVEAQIDLSKYQNGYVLFYGLKNSKDNSKLVDLLMCISNKYSLPIIDISPINNGIKSPNYKRINVGPGEFLSYIKNASYVVSNSFHGTVFSILYNREFYVSLPELKSERIISLLSILGIENRIIKDNSEIANINAIDYNKVLDVLEEERKTSKEFLANALK